ncbi:MAG: hypothetical protein UX87_C0015G0015 [Candidatus Amesbacteria bacterium GW2011_GWA1_47_16]|uniref:Uncharacterized protein n=2 Tax=Candidatus Amesiibacteriota TaxID=1752730 RepID=A0A0G1USX2_9BACT|nr:MAG: hypothetical protein UX87_C0015G0015 [Candidatus Amesbacteria bacterium GW2011_GWA1_47_16]KKU97312.1 MAG: hypothetical protein UY28_C0025G0014 [Candidatus Amesbacteria bacterium GW2011_GWB1_48_13]
MPHDYVQYLPESVYAVTWAAVKYKYEKNVEGEWVEKEE